MCQQRCEREYVLCQMQTGCRSSGFQVLCSSTATYHTSPSAETVETVSTQRTDSTCASACSWPRIAAQLPGRSGKQCRERWHNQLDPSVSRDSWTEEEDKILATAHEEVSASSCVEGGKGGGGLPLSLRFFLCDLGRSGMQLGNQWSEIAKRLPGSDTSHPLHQVWL